ncbi:kunitz-type serine protease inhibitor cvp2-like [Scaptodrosophila lebanonensis]|uniref:Kunitz-type serine protease inhibitor cvp2-like n=1 Tax=Drosophila lebanonensis TaxID=7225 RepID=A0A6J2U780_DROLE|nr:kunitz-type serine protease inhibitor cvp2-like [Scaptodrosophila lebanonensis]
MKPISVICLLFALFGGALGALNPVCLLQPFVDGNCKGAFPRWSFIGEECGSFLYGGCGGNANNFKSETACKLNCNNDF